MMSSSIYAFLLGVIVGVSLVLAAVWYVLSFFFLDSKTSKTVKTPVPAPSTFQLPPVLLTKINDESCKSKESCWAVNFVLYFLFRELRNSEHIRRWILRKLSMEFEELLSSSVLGKFFSSITIHNLDLGQNIPVFNWLKTSRVELHPIFKSISTVDIVVDLDYSGGFQFSIQAETHLKRSAFLSVQFNAVKGQARLQFTTEPYAHWSFSFIENPDIDISVVSQLYGKSFSQVTSIIASQLKRSVRKKHTLPMFKIRYKPFFERKDQITASLLPQTAHPAESRGTLTVTLIECRGLMSTLLHGNIYAQIGIGDFSWVAAYPESSSFAYLILDVVCVRTNKRESELDFQLCITNEIPTVESVTYKHSAVHDGNHLQTMQLEVGDEIVAVDGKLVTSIKQCLKNHRASASMKVVWRIRRRLSLGECAFEERGMSTSKSSTFSTDGNQAEVSNVNDPNSSSSSRRSSDETAVESNGNHAKRRSSFSFRMPLGAEGPNMFEVFRSSDFPSSKDPIFTEGFDLNVSETNRYINITLWTACAAPSEPNAASNTPSSSPSKKSKVKENTCLFPFGKDKVVGMLSIPVANIITECSTTGMGYFAKDYHLGSPDGSAADARELEFKSHSGFEPTMCYGKISISFLYKTSEEHVIRRKDSPDTDSAHSNLIPSEIGVEATPESVELRAEDLHSHQFVRTHFRSATVCDYCNKKIWLKEAYMCRSCSMKCHKKCHERCMANTVCRGYAGGSSISIHGSTPEIITTDSDHPHSGTCDKGDQEEDGSEPVAQGNTVRRRTLGGLIASAVQNRSVQLRRVGSATSLFPPNFNPHGSKSLPESPQASPTTSRKGSITSAAFGGNPFELLDSGGPEMSEEDLSAAVESLILHASDEDLVSLAKETGRDVFNNLTLQARKEKLNNVLSRLQEEIDVISNERMALGKDDSNTSPYKSSASSHAAKCEERVQALAVLMLHFCSGLQHVQDMEEMLQKEAEREPPPHPQ